MLDIEFTKNYKTELICSHEIKYWYRDYPDLELDEFDIEHIQNLLIENYAAGELCQCIDRKTGGCAYGWWTI